MSKALIVVGRSTSADLQLDHPTVSGNHARLRWEGLKIDIEDLGSANGTFVNGERVAKATIRPGDDVRFGEMELPWSDPRLRSFLREGASGTLVATSIPGRRFICGNCNTRGVMPPGFRGGMLACGACGEKLVAGKPKAKSGVLSGLLLVLIFGLLAGAGYWLWINEGDTLREAITEAGAELPSLPELPVLPIGPSVGSPQEASIRAHTVEPLTAAIDSRESLTRNTAVQLASAVDGPFSVEQVAKIWSHVRGAWRYVNDPRGSEYFALASETIANEYVGDCDDFAIVMSAMIEGIGGRVRVVMMDGIEENDGHAYPEVCIELEPEEVQSHLRRHYRQRRNRSRNRSLGSQRVGTIHFRMDESCPTWLNLDWNAGVPGGEYTDEVWAVAVYPDGTTETLAPAHPNE